MPRKRLVALFLLAVTTAARAAEPGKLLWERSVAGAIVALALSPDEQCIVVATTQAMMKLDRDGTVLWRRSYPNKWMAQATQGRESELAVLPGCRGFIFAGDSSYRHVWFFQRNGKAITHLATHGTPQSAVINHRGNKVAIAVGDGQVLLTNPHGKVLRSMNLGSTVPRVIAFSPDDTLLLISGLGTAGLFASSGDSVWTRSGSVITAWPSDDWQRFLILDEPGHGYQVDKVEILARDGTIVWRRDEILDATAQMTADSSRFIISSRPSQPGAPADEYDSLRIAPIVLDHNGNVLEVDPATIPHIPCPSESPNDLSCHEDNGKVLATTSFEREGGAPHLTFQIEPSPSGGQPPTSIVRAYRKLERTP